VSHAPRLNYDNIAVTIDSAGITTVHGEQAGAMNSPIGLERLMAQRP
jgi:hypothetical protein